MINAEEALKISESFAENYRRQERITLENNVSKWIEDAAKEGKQYCLIVADPEDTDYILEKLKKNGFRCDVFSTDTQFGKKNINVRWDKYASTNDDCEHTKKVLQPRLVLNRR